jgi:MraZ protein
MLTNGIYSNTLDDKGRVSIPVRFREGFACPSFVVTKGLEHCLWLYPPETWTEFEKKLRRQIATLPVKKSAMIQHRFLIPAQELEIDKTGRIALPAELRDFAALSKDCLFLKNGGMLELWDTASYSAYQEKVDENLADIMDDMSLDFSMSSES